MAEINTIIDQITHWGLTGLWKLVFAVIIWFVGKKVISISLRLLKKIFDKGSLDAGVYNVYYKVCIICSTYTYGYR